MAKHSKKSFLDFFKLNDTEDEYDDDLFDEDEEYDDDLSSLICSFRMYRSE